VEAVKTEKLWWWLDKKGEGGKTYKKRALKIWRCRHVCFS